MHSDADADRLVIYPSRTKTLLVLLGSLVFVALGIWIATPDMASQLAAWKVAIASYVGIPFFGGCGLYAAYRLANRRPALEIDSTGITDAASAVGVGHLRWDEIEYVVPQVILPMKVEELAELLRTRYGVQVGTDT